MCVSGYPTLPVKMALPLQFFFQIWKKKSFLVRKVPLPGSEMTRTQDAYFHDLHKILNIFCHYKV